MEIIDGMIYIVGDDSPFLFCLDPYLNQKAKVELYFPDKMEEGRIPKKKKADLESICKFKINGYWHLLLIGSGSKGSERDTAFLVKLPTPYNRKHIVWEKDLTEFYNFLRSHDEIVSNGKLNLEGSATSKDFLVLYNRGNKNGNNAALYFELNEFVEFIQGHTEGVPFPHVSTFNLPDYNSVNAGFSGACIFEDKLFFTASVEDTVDAYEDGPVSCSYLGWKEVFPFDTIRGNFKDPGSDIKDTCLIMKDEKPFVGKVESVSVYEKDQDKYIALAVTDSDDGYSEILMIEIEL